MNLTPEETKSFFELMGLLQYYVNGRLKIIVNCGSLGEYTELPMEEKLKVRDALYKQSGLIDEYVSANPDQLDAEKLTIIKEWKGFIKGDFYIERHLNSHTIFMEDTNVYGVLGLFDGLDQIMPKACLPVYVKTVLLPFKGKIVYDGLMQSYNIHFGGGIKRDLSETYMRAKQNGKIVFSLGEVGPEQINKKEKKVTKQIDWSKEINQLISVSKKLKSGSGQPVMHGPIFNLVRDSVELANKAVLESSDVEIELRKVKKAVRKIENILYRFE